MSLTVKQAQRAAWSYGHLEHKFRKRPQQLEVYQQIRACWANRLQLAFFLAIHRQWGKSRLLLVLALEEMARTPGTRVVYVTDTKVHAEDIVIPLIEKLLDEDCPRDLRPEYKKHDKTYYHPNGSQLSLYAADTDQIDAGRGVAARLLLFDEAGYIDGLKQAMAAFLPVLATTGGFCVAASTPPPISEHPFELLFHELVQVAYARLIRFSENPDATPEMRSAAEQYRKLMGEAAYLREWECHWGINDDYRIVVPEFIDLKSKVVKEMPIPEGSDHYVGFDPGGRDFHAVVFASWVHGKKHLVVEDELFMRGVSTADLALKIKEKERALWGSDPGLRVRRFSDTGPQLLYDLATLHKLRFQVTAKDDKKGAIQNFLRVELLNGTIYIHPRCKKLIRTLIEARWEKNFKQYTRPGEKNPDTTVEENIGHADLLDALLYLLRNVARNSPPASAQVPANYLANTTEDPRNKAAFLPFKGRAPSANAQRLAAQLRKFMGVK